MRVRISQKETKSWPFATVRQVIVFAQVEFSHEELAIIAERQLEDYVVLERPPDSRTIASFGAGEFERWEESFHLRIRDLTQRRPDRFVVDTPSDAKAYAARLTEALAQLKIFIAENARVAPPRRLEF